MRKLFKQKNRGFTLVETLVAISIFTIGILSLMSVLASGIANTNYAKEKMAASYLAQQGIEYVRNMRDNYVLYTSSTGLSWNTFLTADKSDPSPDPNFTRTIQMITIPSNGNEVQIISTVSWVQKSGNYHVTFSENLYNWTE